MQKELDFEWMEKNSDASAEALDFTMRSEEAFYDTVDLEAFSEQDAETIYSFLVSEIQQIPFGDYLKRYIYSKSGMKGDFRAIDLQIYQEAIALAFAENNTPRSFTETSAKLSALAKNWLTQTSIARINVFLLGFGLGMSVEDVSSFLLKALKERDFNFKNPIEIILWYCFRNGIKYPKFHDLKKRFENMAKDEGSSIYEDKTFAIRHEAASIYDEESLMEFLTSFAAPFGKSIMSVTIEQRFRELYQKSKEIIAGYYNLDEAEKPAGARRAWRAEDIGEGDVERILCNGTPYDAKGNLVRVSASKLAKYFSGKRLSRQHLHDILADEVPIDRFDLITLNFFVFSQDTKYETDNKNRFLAFTDSMNGILNECGMGELYIANPYECFLMMCILSDCPLATYADVWEMSYEDDKGGS